jgi:hypothetical protein
VRLDESRIIVPSGRMVTAGAALREQLIEMLVMEENRLEHAPQALHRRLATYINYLRQQSKRAGKDLDRVVRSSGLWDQYELLSSVPWLGSVTNDAMRKVRRPVYAYRGV